MERGKEQEVVYEFSPEPLAGQRQAGAGAKGPGSAATRVAASSAMAAPLRENENIDTAAMNAGDALKRFLEKEARHADFEAEVAKIEAQAKRRPVHEPAILPHGARAPGGERIESPEQRCARLQVEVMELLRLAESSRHDPVLQAELLGMDPKAAMADLRALEKLLRGLRRVGHHPTAGASAQEGSDDVGGPGAISQALLSQFDRFSDCKVSHEASAEEGKVTWEVNFAPSTIPILESSQLATLESNLAEIDKKMGTPDASAKFKDAYSVMVQLHRRMGLLDPHKLESIRSVVSRAMLGMETALKHKDELQAMPREPAVDKKVVELHECCHRWTATAAALPAVVTRMQSLEHLHQQSASFTARLSALEHQQDELVKVLEVTNMALQDLNRGMQENMAVLKENMRTLETKLSKKK